MNILMVAAENDALPGGKVGGIADVLRSIPIALAEAGQQVQVVTPGYQRFSRLAGAKKVATVELMFANYPHSVEVFRVPAKSPHNDVVLWALEHPLFAAGGAGKIYCDDGSDRPFATDASKFALFSAAVAKAVVDKVFGQLDVLHLHDWHAAMVAVLREFDPQYKALQKIPTVYTIHNLALQGVRPFADDDSSLQAWFPGLSYKADLINDPNAPHCINLMRAGINLSDKVHAVSPTYAREILQPSNYQQGYFGGEGLEQDLQRAANDKRLFGILNGCEYPEKNEAALSLIDLLLFCEIEQLAWMGKTALVDSAHLIAHTRISHGFEALSASANAEVDSRAFIATSVGRVTDQKVLLLKQRMPDGASALDHMLDVIGDHGLFIMLGNGDKALEQFLTEVAGRRRNFIFLKGYAENLSRYLYSTGDLFLMPSSFEPCGISQMLAMREGQPCLVHKVGGLSDTVVDGKTGFMFSGDSLPDQAVNMVQCLAQAVELWQSKPKTWTRISNAAAKARFLWADVAAEYLKLLYK